MKVDPAAYVGAVVREVSTREHQGQPARVVVATRSYDTDIEDLWDALTNAERIPRWFLPISGQFEGNAGGEITRCEPPRLLSVTWEYGGGTSWLTVALSDNAAAGTRLELEHVAPVDDAMWDRFGPGAVGVGWDLGLLGLALYLAGGAAFERSEAMAWSASDEGKAYMRASSEAWGEASIRAGTPAEAAKAAAARTSAFYCGEPEPSGS